MKMTNKKTPYLVIWKQILLSIFTLGIWCFVWQNRVTGFTNQLSSKKKDAETQSLLAILVPPMLIPWALGFISTINKDEKKRFSLAMKIVFIAILSIASLLVAIFDIAVIALAITFVFTKLSVLGYAIGAILLVRFMVAPIALLPVLIVAQFIINKMASDKGITSRVAYSSGAVNSPYTKVWVYVVLTIITLGIWTYLAWISKTTAFLNRVSEEKRHKLDEVLLCFLVPGYYFYWAIVSARQTDEFSSSLGEENRIYKKVFILSIIGLACASVLVHAINIIIQLALNKDVYMRKVESEGILEIRNLRKCFPIGKTLFGTVTRELNAVKNASFVLKAGETLGIVGESGCGKTTMGRTILKLYPSEEGQIIFNGYDITYCPKSQTRKMRKDMQIIFQDPYSSLPPRSTVGGILTEPVQVHKIVPASQRKQYVLELMDKCGLRDYYYERYPHEFSGGQRQRICIARALSVNPKLVICDEPVSALDVSIQAQIINLLKDLQNNMGLTYLFISHDLSVVKYISDKIGVMYLGTMVEFGKKEDIFGNPLHPYTKALFSAIPNPNPDEKMNRMVLTGDIPSPANPPKGCAFHTRCPYAKDICKTVTPEYKEHEDGHYAACHLI